MTKRARRREPQAQTDVCGSVFRQHDSKRHLVKKVLKPSALRAMVSYLLAAYKVSIARACSVVGLHRSMGYYQAKKDDSEVVAKLKELAEKLPTRGFDVYYNRIRTEG